MNDAPPGDAEHRRATRTSPAVPRNPVAGRRPVGPPAREAVGGAPLPKGGQARILNRDLRPAHDEQSRSAQLARHIMPIVSDGRSSPLVTYVRRMHTRSPHRRWVLILSLLVAGWPLVAGGCGERETYTPPDLFYLFATYQVGKNPTAVLTADLDEDGLTDVITTNIGNNSLSILFGNGDGTFKDQVEVEVGREPRAMVLADFNGDDRQDLAVACSGSDQIALFFGLGNGKFASGQRYAVHRTPVSVVSGDLNGDGHADLAVALRNDKIRIMLGRGDGTFVEGPEYEHGDTPTSLALQDLNGDGRLDLAVSNGGPMSSAVTIWLGNGDGSFRASGEYRTGKRPLVVTVADFNSDAKTDLLVINGEMDSFTVFLGVGDGTFQSGLDAGADAGPVNGLARDFNGDRITDVAIVNVQSSDLSILFGRGDGTFRYPPMNYRAKGGPFALASLALTAQPTGEPALVTANNAAGTVSVFLHRGLKGAGSRAMPAPS